MGRPGFVDFREEIEGGGARIRDMKERDIKGGEITVSFGLCGIYCVSVVSHILCKYLVFLLIPDMFSRKHCSDTI